MGSPSEILGNLYNPILQNHVTDQLDLVPALPNDTNQIKIYKNNRDWCTTPGRWLVYRFVVRKAGTEAGGAAAARGAAAAGAREGESQTPKISSKSKETN